MRAALHAAMYAAILGMACGGKAVKTRPLDKAGGVNDDGSGQLARASVKLLTSTDEGGFEPEMVRTTATYDTYGYGYGYGYGSGHTYGGFGGDGYGGGGYGGMVYGGYQMPHAAYVAPRVPAYAVNYATVAEGGAIEGHVRWPRPPAHDAKLAVPGCGTADNRSMVLGAKGAVTGAVVYLETIKSGRAWGAGTYGRQATVGGVVELRRCALGPRVQLHGPLPGQLHVTNVGDTPVEIVADRPDDPAFVRVVHALEGGGTKQVGVTSPGITRVADARGAMPPAWVMTQDHPYYTLTDDSGKFRLDEIVPGDYTLVVWHPPVVTAIKDGVAQYGAPVVVRKKVTVKKTATSKLAIDL